MVGGGAQIQQSRKAGHLQTQRQGPVRSRLERLGRYLCRQRPLVPKPSRGPAPPRQEDTSLAWTAGNGRRAYSPSRRLPIAIGPRNCSRTSTSLTKGNGGASNSKRPRPIRSWPESNLSKELLRPVKRAGYEKPSPIQMAAIPLGLQRLVHVRLLLSFFPC